GQVFSVTTNPAEATGDGLAMALRAGVPVADVEFMQFHPTALHHPAMPRPLLSEALRGHGALLRDARGERFVDELAPRDVVSRAMAERMHEQGVDNLWLDATALDSFDARFPTISASLADIGLDPATDWLPIAPAAHYLSGGVLTDLWGATALPGLWAAGEVACTGVHGANRLASNSLLEGMVFGARLAETILAGGDGPTATGVLAPVLEGRTEAVALPAPLRTDWVPTGGSSAGPVVGPGGGPGGGPALDVAKSRDQLQRAMTDGAGVVRSAGSLARADATVRELAEASGDGVPVDRDRGELANLVTAAISVLASATLRTETRGAHARSDYPEASDAWRCRIVHGGPNATTVLARTPTEPVGPDGRPRP
ncbi:MAG TPA: FAD-binding protein, partial [Acidimicrobiales bacterium]